MKKKILILGSTGSIGKNTIKIINKEKKKFNIILLSTNKNITEVVKQAINFNVKNIIVTNNIKFKEAKEKYKKLNINFYNSFSNLDKILNNQKIFYSMISIVGLDGLYPALKSIKYSANIAIVNKESLICGWNLIKKELKKYNTNFIPIDSEHFSISELIKKESLANIEKIYITASGGPFLNYSKSKLSNVTVKETLNHPNWKMGKKISVDSATLINKVFEVIEAKNIFNISYNKISILIHPKSYIHALIKFNNGQIKILAHEANMRIPIHNSLYFDEFKKIKTNSLNLNILNNLKLQKINNKQFPLINILNSLPKNNSLYETVLVTINDYFVFKFLEKKINFKKLIDLIKKYSEYAQFIKFKKIPVKNINDIYRTRDYVTYKLDILGI